MRRRALLARAGSLTALGVAGCLGSNGAASPGTETETPTATSDAAPRFDPEGEPIETTAVGDRSDVLLPEQNRPHAVTVWNDAGTARSVRLLVERNGAIALDRTWTVPADRAVALVLREPGTYVLHVHVDGADAGSIPVGAIFDCNETRTNVRVGPDGGLSTTVVSTQLACRGPGVAAHDFEVLGSSCGSRDAAAVTFGAHAVAVTGRVTAPTPCHGATLAGATWDAASGTLTLTVATTDREVDGCVQCIGEVAYEATVSFVDAPPQRVVIEHDHRGRTEVVATASRDG